MAQFSQADALLFVSQWMNLDGTPSIIRLVLSAQRSEWISLINTKAKRFSLFQRSEIWNWAHYGWNTERARILLSKRQFKNEKENDVYITDNNIGHIPNRHCTACLYGRRRRRKYALLCFVKYLRSGVPSTTDRLDRSFLFFFFSFIFFLFFCFVTIEIVLRSRCLHISALPTL